jgi:hypothetical protein
LFRAVEDFGFPLEHLPFEEWRTRIVSRRSGTVALLGLVPFLNDAVDRVRLPHSESARTQADLCRFGIACPPLDRDLVHTYLRAFIASGFTNPPGTSSSQRSA